MTEYKDYEFCIAMNCKYYYPKNRFEEANCACNVDCVHSAKEFHKWLVNNNFKLLKKNNKDEETIRKNDKHLKK